MSNNLPPNLPALKAGWSMVKLSDVCEIIMGQSPPSSTYNIEKIGLPFFQGKAEFTEINPEVIKWCSLPKKIAEPNDILLSVRAPVGSTNIANQKCCIGRGLAAIRYSDCYKFIFYYLRKIEKELDKLGTGTTFKAISSKTLIELQIPLPPHSEQKKIVAKIEELFSELDSGVANLRKAKEQIKTYRQSVLAYAFTGNLTQERRTQSAELRMKKENSTLYAHHSTLPPGWKWVKLGEVAERIQYGYTESASKEQIGPKFLRITDIQNGNVIWDEVPYCKISDEEKKKYLLKDYDIVFARTGATVGKSFLIIGKIPESIFASYLIRIQLSKTVKPNYIYYFFQSNSYWRQISEGQVGIGQPNVNGRKLSQIVIPICPFEEQHQIVSEIERRFSVADKLEQTIDESLTNAGQLRQSILKKAFCGELV